MNRTLNIFFLIVLMLIAHQNSTAQTNGSNSPYSRYGFGLLSDGGQGFNKGMAGVAYGMSDGQQINYKNPASYADLDSLSMILDMGLTLQNANLKQGGRSMNARNTSIDYLAAGFSRHKNLGLSLGFMPFSTVGYEMSSTAPLNAGTSNVTQTQSYTGNGGTHSVYAGIGWRPISQLAVGANIAYFWGSLSHSVTASFSDAGIDSHKRVYEADISTYKLDFGVQYTQAITAKDKLTLGLTYSLGHDIPNSAKYYNQRISSSNVASADTQHVSKAFSLPHTFGAGLAWKHNENLRVGLDYTLQLWERLKFPGLKDNDVFSAEANSFNNLHKIAGGVEYIPNPSRATKWHQLIRYRAGISYTSSYIKVDGKDGPNSFLVSAGVGLPIVNKWRNNGNRFTMLNISAQYERVAPRHSGMITENYLRLTVGLTFDERWFWKLKVK